VGFASGISLILILAVNPPGASAQLLQRPVAFQGARIVTMDGRVIENGTLLIKGEKITAIGTSVDVPLLAVRIDAKGHTITPGFIDAFSALGAAASGSGSPNALRRAEDGFDRYDSELLTELLRNGVTAAYLSPAGPPGVSGTGAVLRLAAAADRRVCLGTVLESPAALCINLDSAGKPIARIRNYDAIRKQFAEAVEYRRTLEDYQEDLAKYEEALKEQAKEKAKAKDSAGKQKANLPPKSKSAAVDKEDEAKPDAEKKDAAEDEKKSEPKKPARPPRKPALTLILKAIDRELPVRALAYRSSDILNALELADEFSLDLILAGATEAHLVADQIADAKTPVLLGRMDVPGEQRDDWYRRTARDPGRILDESGVSWHVGSGGLESNRSRFILLNALLAHEDFDRALRSVTADAAEALRVSDRIGRLRPGLLADFVVWSADPREPTARVLQTYVGGTLVYESNDDIVPGARP
jgi:imidazolonepropionase-like amidohydrolase